VGGAPAHEALADARERVRREGEPDERIDEARGRTRLRRADEDERRDGLRMAGRLHHRDEAAHRVADEDDGAVGHGATKRSSSAQFASTSAVRPRAASARSRRDRARGRAPAPRAPTPP
jgi:hypothetical protein